MPFLHSGDVSGNFQACLTSLASGMLVPHAGLFAFCSVYVVICVSELDMQCVKAVLTQCKVGSSQA